MPLRWYERALAFAGGVSLIVALPISDEIGFGITVLVAALIWLRGRKGAPAAA